MALYKSLVVTTILISFLSNGVAQESSYLYPDKAKYEDSSAVLKQKIKHKTAFEVDCRAGKNSNKSSGKEECMRPFEVAVNRGSTVGDGPSFGTWPGATISGGFIDYTNNELIASVHWDNSKDGKGLVVAYNMEDWSRRFISGDAQDDYGHMTIAKGPAFNLLKDIKPGPDGNWYAFSYVYRKNTKNSFGSGPVIFKVDPKTGDRETVWEARNPAFGQCPSGRKSIKRESQKFVQYTQEVFTVDPQDGSFIVSFSNSKMGGTGFGRVSKDGAKCNIISVSGQRDDDLKVGRGFDMRGPMLGAYLHDGKLYSHSTGEKTLFEINPATGDRKAIIRKGPKPEAWRHVQWDDKREVFWISGKMSSAMVTAWRPGWRKILITDKSCSGRDKEWADWFPLCKEGPLATLTLNYGPMWYNKNTGTLLFGYDSIGIVEFEPETGNSINRSL